MKKTYLNPRIRVVNLTESDAILMDISNSPVDTGKGNDSRRNNDWDEEDW